MEQNKTGKPAFQAGRYLKYAIGEIILVVLGILIALQINTWNSDRKTQLQEKVILQSLLDEFKTNSNNLLLAKKSAAGRSEKCLEILKYISDDKLELSKATSDDLIMKSLNTFVTFDVSDGYINSLLSTGEIHILENDSLKHLITNWERVVIDNSSEAEDWLKQDLYSIVTPFLDKHYSLATERFKSFNPYNAPIKFDHMKIYRNPYFENIVIRKANRYYTCIVAYNELDKYLDKLISITEKELQLIK
jgi:hypothetical protein